MTPGNVTYLVGAFVSAVALATMDVSPSANGVALVIVGLTMLACWSGR